MPGHMCPGNVGPAWRFIKLTFKALIAIQINEGFKFSNCSKNRNACSKNLNPGLVKLKRKKCGSQIVRLCAA